MKTYYTNERNAQILISLLKEHHIRRIIASPGTTNVCLLASLQQDSYFKIYSSVDERSAAYIACGMAAETGEPVALSCTGATASRNYAPGLTEAYYRKLPVLAITSSRPNSQIGHNIPQVTDRCSPMPDMVKLSVQMPVIRCMEDEWDCEIKANQAILELTRHGGGPVHINLITEYSADFTIKELPKTRVINRFTGYDMLPMITANQVGIFVGAHQRWEEKLTETVDRFCERYNGVVLCDATSNYHGKYGVMANLVANQWQHDAPCKHMDLIIHLGDISGAYMDVHAKQVWRVNPDGEIRDPFRTLRYVFEMEELEFFSCYLNGESMKQDELYFCEEWKQEYSRFLSAAQAKEDDIPFSNVWIAMNTMPNLPQGSALHLGILNSLRSWNYFALPEKVLGYCNTGGFGIDGGVSALLGAALVRSEKLTFGVVGDLAFFYDLNALGNRHMPSNFRLLLINNGRGQEFRNKDNLAYRAGLGDRTDDFIAAAGHFGYQSPELVKNFAQDLGFEYMTASNKEEFLHCMKRFVTPEITKSPMLLEAFTQTDQERDALQIFRSLEATAQGKAKQLARDVLGSKNIQAIKNIIKK